MLQSRSQDLVRSLRAGAIDASQTAWLDRVDPSDLVAEFRNAYPICFQERTVKQKREIGLARSLQFKLTVHSNSHCEFPPVYLTPCLRRCVFLSFYGAQLTEVTIARQLEIRHKSSSQHSLILRLGRGFKLDKTPDGWTSKTLEPTSAELSEDFLKQRGWRFEALVPFLHRP